LTWRASGQERGGRIPEHLPHVGSRYIGDIGLYELRSVVRYEWELARAVVVDPKTDIDTGSLKAVRQASNSAEQVYGGNGLFRANDHAAVGRRNLCSSR
jgi:hypothetical protein